jgi:hypothetical protein
LGCRPKITCDRPLGVAHRSFHLRSSTGRGSGTEGIIEALSASMRCCSDPLLKPSWRNSTSISPSIRATSRKPI